MTKIKWKPGTMIYPLPAVMVTCGASPEDYNIITIAWTGTVCTDPPMCYISIRPSRYSYGIIKESGEFTINLTTKDMARSTDWCGIRSGRDYDKFSETGLTPVPGIEVRSPMILESPVNIECKVKEILELGVHHMFLSEVLAIYADKQYYDNKTEVFNLERSNLLSYSHGKYFETGPFIGKFGFSVRKKMKIKNTGNTKKT